MSLSVFPTESLFETFHDADAFGLRRLNRGQSVRFLVRGWCRARKWPARLPIAVPTSGSVQRVGAISESQASKVICGPILSRPSSSNSSYPIYTFTASVAVDSWRLVSEPCANAVTPDCRSTRARIRRIHAVLTPSLSSFAQIRRLQVTMDRCMLRIWPACRCQAARASRAAASTSVVASSLELRSTTFWAHAWVAWRLSRAGLQASPAACSSAVYSVNGPQYGFRRSSAGGVLFVASNGRVAMV